MEKGFVSAHTKKNWGHSPFLPIQGSRGGKKSEEQSQEQTEISATVARVQHQIRQACLFYLAASTAPFSTM